ncbi:MAG: hypothetical protein RR137_10865 [Odoribacter sp.]
MDVIIIDRKDYKKLSNLDTKELRNLVIQTAAEKSRLEKEIKSLKDENDKITEIANRSSVALAELKQGISDAIDVSEAYYR